MEANSWIIRFGKTADFFSLYPCNVFSHFSSTLLSVIAQLTELSPGIQQQLLQTKGFLVIGNMLLKVMPFLPGNTLIFTFLF